MLSSSSSSIQMNKPGSTVMGMAESTVKGIVKLLDSEAHLEGPKAAGAAAAPKAGGQSSRSGEVLTEATPDPRPPLAIAKPPPGVAPPPSKAKMAAVGAGPSQLKAAGAVPLPKPASGAPAAGMPVPRVVEYGGEVPPPPPGLPVFVPQKPQHVPMSALLANDKKKGGKPNPFAGNAAKANPFAGNGKKN